ncbi:MAG TPA: hypothetical protein VK705_04255 [Ferruginibacter sp.]|jgi:hypothetical protein|nr:hypothetical protein [Ferruginibacter sp.]
MNNQKVPIQPLPITIDNFFVRTTGVFKEIEFIPVGYVGFFNSKESAYYHSPDKDKIVRVSNHWGFSIRFCAWFLDGYEKESSFKWGKNNGKQMRIGIISINELKPNLHLNWSKTNRKKIESRHPIDDYIPQNPIVDVTNIIPKEIQNTPIKISQITKEQDDFFLKIFGQLRKPKNLIEHLAIRSKILT